MGLVCGSPGWAVTTVAAFAVIASAYPLIFLGKHCLTEHWRLLLYPDYPTYPVYLKASTLQRRRLDIGALMWALCHLRAWKRSALSRHELPALDSLQLRGHFFYWAIGLSMFGDPLHFLISFFQMMQRWAGILKYLLAKSLLAVGLDCVPLRTTRHLPHRLVYDGNCAVYRTVHLSYPSPGNL